MTADTSASLLSTAAAIALLCGLGAAFGSSTAGDVIDRRDVRILRERALERGTALDTAVEAARLRLQREGLDAASVERAGTAIRRRLTAEVSSYIESLRGLRFASLETAHAAVKSRERVLCYVAGTWPTGFAEGRSLTFVVDQEDAEALLRQVDEMILDTEGPLRSTVRALAASREISTSDAQRLRDFSRMRATSRARSAIDEIRGAPFFSKQDARFYVENALAAELEGILSALRDPAARVSMLERARSRDGIGS